MSRTQKIGLTTEGTDCKSTPVDMKRIIIFAILICFSNMLLGQTATQQDSVITLCTTSYTVVTFKEHSLALTEKGKETLNFIAEIVNDTLFHKYRYMITISPSQYERKGLGFKRVGVILDYLENVCNVKAYNFLFRYVPADTKFGAYFSLIHKGSVPSGEK